MSKTKMKAVVADRYGPPGVLRIEEVDKPHFGDDDVLLRVRAASVNPYDWHTLTGKPYLVRTQGGWRRPKQRLHGVDVAGVVDAVGSGVTEFAIGDEVFGCGRGSYAEFVAASTNRVVHKPPRASFEQAAAVPIAAITALQALRDKGKIQKGSTVLITGAGGGVGSFAVQIAKSYGADVTAVCRTDKVEMVRSIGADHVIDYTREDFTRSGERYDIILDMVKGRSFRRFRRVLEPGGIYVSVGMAKKGNWIQPLTHVLKLKLASLVGRRRMVFILSKMTKEDLVVLQEMLESGAVTPVVGARFALADTADAMTLIGGGHASGKIVVTV